MALIADILLIAGALGATLYCHVLARRLNRFNDLEKGMGGAVAVLSAQVDDMTKALQTAQGSAQNSSAGLETLTGRAEDVAHRLELLVAAMHDLPVEHASPSPTPAPATDHPVPDHPVAKDPEPQAPEAAPGGLFRRNRMQEAAE